MKTLLVKPILLWSDRPDTRPSETIVEKHSSDLRSSETAIRMGCSCYLKENCLPNQYSDLDAGFGPPLAIGISDNGLIFLMEPVALGIGDRRQPRARRSLANS
ncbi:hypothetical protein EVAR_25696_1 [Eumeta japonica]|uniref:Uncharacterized protein n=1 Tax=Eumeta variegata TaxID=151549 RepID=A0A4C1WEC2_EUMVA|nr:hypothetical protein EVAR_25696_1 [Eumeta japonica]